MLRSVDWELVTDVSRRLIGPVFKDQAEQGDFSTLKKGMLSYPEMSVSDSQSTLHDIPQDRKHHEELFLNY